jgi:hypothetical protein
MKIFSAVQVSDGLLLIMIELVWYGMVWCPSYPLDRNRCDQVVAAELAHDQNM